VERTCVVTGAASGIGAATARRLRGIGCHVITSDLHDADVIADLATPSGRAALVEGVAQLSGGRIDAVVANAGGGPPATSVQLNFFGAVATLQGLRPLLAASPAPRAVAVSSIASMRPGAGALAAKCLAGDEAAAIDAARHKLAAGHEIRPDGVALPGTQAALDIYGGAKQALQRWCRRAAARPDWAGAGITLNVVALGFYDTQAASYVLANAATRASMSAIVPLKGSFPGRPYEAAALLAWCVSRENSQMIGQIMFADGGLECRSVASEAAPERTDPGAVL
jgi:NAD(P)-dependent dehydrogenase (short-subunit alcohol dehydrogenase family)